MTRPLRHFVTPPPNPSDLGEEGRAGAGRREGGGGRAQTSEFLKNSEVYLEAASARARAGLLGEGLRVAKHPRSIAKGVASPKPVQTLCFTSNQRNSPVGVSHSTRAASTWEPRGPRSTAWANSSSAARSPSASVSTWS